MISPSLSLRQCPNRYAFRAGWNLPDKEFRYLRTVIVTAAVYGASIRSFAEANHSSTFQHRAGVSPDTSPYGLAETCVFDKQSLGPDSLRLFWALTLKSTPSPEVTGHFAEFLNESSLAHLRILILTTCVGLRYGHLSFYLRGFSRQCEINDSKTQCLLPITAQP